MSHAVFSTMHPFCRYCGEALEYKNGHVCDSKAYGTPHRCIEEWKIINEAFEHAAPRRARSHSMERSAYHELRLGDGKPTSLEQLGVPSNVIRELIIKLREAGVDVQAGWRVGASNKFGLRVRQRVYWLK